MRTIKLQRRQKTRLVITFIFFLLFPVTIYYLSPVISIMAANQGIINGSIVSFVLLFISALFLGRGFFSWGCPAGFIQDIYTLIKPKKVKLKWLKFAFWIPWVSVLIILFIKSNGIQNIQLLFNMESPISFMNQGAIFIYFALIILITLLSLLVGKHSFCHHVCWMSPFMIIGRKLGNVLNIASLHIKSIPSNCNECGACTKNCPMDIHVTAKVKTGLIDASDCINCGECVDACHTNAINYTYSTMNYKTKIN
jgi:polyferredoxin